MDALEALVVDGAAARRGTLVALASALRVGTASAAPRVLEGVAPGPQLLLAGEAAGPAAHPAGLAVMATVLDLLAAVRTPLRGAVRFVPSGTGVAVGAPDGTVVAAPTALLVAHGPGVGPVAPLARRAHGAQVSTGLPFGASDVPVEAVVPGVPTIGFGPCADAVVAPSELVAATRALALLVLRFCGVVDVAEAVRLGPPRLLPLAA